MRKIEAGERRPSRLLAELLARSLEISTFIKVARGDLNVERLASQIPVRAAVPSNDSASSSALIHLPIQLTPMDQAVAYALEAGRV